MKLLSNIKMPKMPKKMIIGSLAVIIVLIGLIIASVFIRDGADEMPVYEYTEIEQQLADAVKEYINECVELPEQSTAVLANEAVKNYRMIISSDVDIVSDDHTEAIQQKLKTTMLDLEGPITELSEEMMDGLSAGIAKIIWEMLYSQVETVVNTSELESNYYYLADSIQGQIAKLEQRKMKVSIQANIENNAADLTIEELLALVEGMTDEEIEELAAKLGLSYEELFQLLAQEETARGEGDQELDEKLEELRKELEKEFEKKLDKELSNIDSASDGTNGRGGRNSTDGKDGQDGKDGKDGKAGRDGESIFIMYAADSSGKDMSKTPNSDTKYMGTYIGTSASSNAADYTWTRYSDATITYSDGTLYITQ